MKRRLIFSIVLIYNCLTIVKGQSELTLYHMTNIHQSSYTNLTAKSDFKFSLGLPGISSMYAGFANTGFSLVKDLYDSVATDGTYRLSTKFIDAMQNKNVIYTGTSVDLLSFKVKWRSAFITFNISDKFDFRLMYPQDLFRFVQNGNADKIGQTFEFSNIRLNAVYYREVGLGFTKEINDKWTIGIRPKLLFGIANVWTQKSTTTLYTGKDVGEANFLRLQSNIVINTNLDSANLSNLDKQDQLTKFLTGSNNLGGAIDLGVAYKINKRLTVSGSLNNLGLIRWKEGVKNYKLDGDVTFKGIQLDNINTSDTNLLKLETLADSISKKVVFDTTSNVYNQRLIAQSYLAVNYQVFRNTTINGLFFADYFVGIRPAFSLGVVQKIGKIVNLSVTYSAQHRRKDNLGIGLMLKPGSFQFYVISDNLTPIIRSLDLGTGELDFAKIDGKNLNIRLGMNLVFGRTKKPDVQTYAE